MNELPFSLYIKNIIINIIINTINIMCYSILFKSILYYCIVKSSLKVL